MPQVCCAGRWCGVCSVFILGKTPQHLNHDSMRFVFIVPSLILLATSAFLLGRMSISTLSVCQTHNDHQAAARFAGSGAKDEVMGTRAADGSQGERAVAAARFAGSGAIVFNPDCKFEIKNKGANLFSEPSSQLGLDYFVHVNGPLLSHNFKIWLTNAVGMRFTSDSYF
jgi:hypothetical protein